MNFEEFKKKYLGKPVDFDGYHGFQCMDLYRQHVKEVLQVPQSPGVNGAKDVWDTYLKEHFDRIENTPTGVPQKGDIVIWGVGVGPYGHIAIFDSGDANSFKSFDQNWPVGSYCHIQQHNYNGVLGWLRKKATDVPPPPQTSLKNDYGAPYGILEVQQASSMLRAKDQDIKSKSDKISELEKEVTILKDTLATSTIPQVSTKVIYKYEDKDYKKIISFSNIVVISEV